MTRALAPAAVPGNVLRSGRAAEAAGGAAADDATADDDVAADADVAADGEGAVGITDDGTVTVTVGARGALDDELAVGGTSDVGFEQATSARANATSESEPHAIAFFT